MKILDIATNRRTTRKFNNESIKEEDIRYILETAVQAPSGSNLQPWRFIIVSHAEQKKRIREAAEKGEHAFYESINEERKKWYNAKGLSPTKTMLTQAPVLLIVLGDTTAPNYKPSVWICIAYAILAAEERGLATVTYTPSDPKFVTIAVEAPKNFSVESIIPLGYSDDSKPKEERKSIHEVSFKDRWGVRSS